MWLKKSILNIAAVVVFRVEFQSGLPACHYFIIKQRLICPQLKKTLNELHDFFLTQPSINKANLSVHLIHNLRHF